MDKGARLLISHIWQKSHIYLPIDPDCDGYTSAALFINYLSMQFPAFAQNNIHYIMHEGKHHGLLQEDIQAVIDMNCKLVVMIDSSSNDYDLHKQLRAAGIDVLVLDHHKAPFVSPDACVINNHLCDYPDKSLSGVGVAYKFCSYLDTLIGEEYADELLDLVAVGCCADMMDLRDFEFRHLFTLGVGNVQNPYLKGMSERNSYSIEKGGGLNPFTVAFYIAPYINATIRVGTQDEKLILFEAMLDFRGYELIPSTKRGCKGQKELRIEQACRNSTNIKNRQTKARDTSLDTIKSVIESKNLLETQKILVICIPKGLDVDKNLTGLIANELANKYYQRPILLLHEVTKENGERGWEGSARNPAHSMIPNLMEFLRATDYCYLLAGHDNAHGVGIYDKDIDAFINTINNELKDFDFQPCYKVDFIYQNNDCKANDVLALAELKGYWGKDLEEPYVVIENISVNKNNTILMSKGTLKITLDNGINLIKFGSSEEEYNALVNSDLGCVKINVVGKCDRNEWNEKVTAQVHIESYEIVSQKRYYF